MDFVTVPAEIPLEAPSHSKEKAALAGGWKTLHHVCPSDFLASSLTISLTFSSHMYHLLHERGRCTLATGSLNLLSFLPGTFFLQMTEQPLPHLLHIFPPMSSSQGELPSLKTPPPSPNSDLPLSYSLPLSLKSTSHHLMLLILLMDIASISPLTPVECEFHEAGIVCLFLLLYPQLASAHRRNLWWAEQGPPKMSKC